MLYARALKKVGRREEMDKAPVRPETLQPNSGQPGAVQAEWLLLDGRQEQARQEIKEALRRTPGLSWAWRTHGLSENARGDREEALRG